MRKIILLLIILLPCRSFSGGFQVAAQGQRSLSMGGAYAAIAADASSVFYNPGAMSFAEKSMVSLGGFLISPKTNYLSPFSGNIKSDNQSLTVLNFYANYKINGKLSAGVGLNNPFGSNMKWADDWEGRYVIQQAKINTTFIQPTVSYKINDKVGIGAGLAFAKGSINWRKALEAGGNFPYGESELKASGSGIGFNAGVFIKVNEELNLGLNYRSSVKLDFKNGNATFTNLPSSLSYLYPATAKFNSTLKLPAVISGGVAYNFTQSLITTIEFDVTQWSAYDSLNFLFPSQQSLDVRSGKKFKLGVTARLGAQYSFSEKFQARIGASYDQSPVTSDRLSPELPDANKILLSIGAGFKFSEKLSGDISLGTESYFERMGKAVENNFSGSYKSNALLIGLGLNYSF